MKFQKRKSGFTLIELLVVIAIVAILIVMGGAVLQGCSPSTGARVGQVVKFSNKGLVVKTWEGDLTTGGLSANGINVWHFTVTDESCIKQLQSAMTANQTVKIDYDQRLIRNPLAGDTTYRVTGVTVITNR